MLLYCTTLRHWRPQTSAALSLSANPSSLYSHPVTAVAMQDARSFDAASHAWPGTAGAITEGRLSSNSCKSNTRHRKPTRRRVRDGTHGSASAPVRMHGHSRSASRRLPLLKAAAGVHVADLLFAGRGGFRGSLVRTCWPTTPSAGQPTSTIIEGCPGARHGECWELHCLRWGKREGFFRLPESELLYPLCGATPTPTTGCVDPPRCGRIISYVYPKCLHRW